MGCVSSKSGFKVDDDLYSPPPASTANFDLNTVGEAWLMTTKSQSTGHVPLSLLEKVDGNVGLEPQSWSEVSKALEDLKPSIENQFPKAQPVVVPVAATVDDESRSSSGRRSIEKKQSFHTLEEVDEKKQSSSPASPVPLAVGLLQPVSQNSFILRDKQEKQEKQEKEKQIFTDRGRMNPLEGLKELCPPGGSESVVLYTTSLRGVRRTFSDCEKARLTVELQCPLGLDIDERDVSLHGEYLREMREVLLAGGEEEWLMVPRLFVKGRYVGGVEEILELNETRRLGQMLRLVRRKKGGSEFGGRKGCVGCGGFRFVLCFQCNGSCKVFLDDEEELVVRCGHCNENGLVECPLCMQISD